MAATSKLISEAAGDLIIEQEVSSEAAYTKKYQRPERPGGASGITIGIGYDCGYSTPDQIRADWANRIPAAMVEILATRAAGLTGDNAQARLAELRQKISVPWAAAISEFYDVEVPRWVAKVKAYLPNTELLPPDCLGALVSLAYNRGPSFNNAGDRYAEMRAIKAAMVAKRFSAIPDQFRSMKRLWAGNPSMRGLVSRREEEAKLFERGLASGVVAASSGIRTGTVSAGALNVRSTASTASPVVKLLPKGAIITITGETMNGDTKWFAVDGGFVAARYVDLN